jgi:hypothetical protein
MMKPDYKEPKNIKDNIMDNIMKNVIQQVSVKVKKWN